MRPLSIVAFLDGRLGHEKQTKGVLKALSEMTPIDVEYKIQDPSFKSGLRDWAAYITSFILLRNKKKSDNNIDLIIGTGSYTHIPMLLLKQECEAKVVTCMTPNFFLRRKIDLCFVPQHDGQKPGANIFFTIGAPSTAVLQDKHDRKKGLILVGGVDKKSHKWRSEAIITKIRSIIEKEQSIKWTITSSPRTPEETIVLLQNLASQNANVDFFRSEDTPGGWIEKEYAKNFTVWVTADSISMIYEALTAGCNVGILPVDWKKKNSKFQRSEDYLLENKLILSYEMWLAGKNENIKVEPLNEASRCAREILRRWWPDRLE